MNFQKILPTSKPNLQAGISVGTAMKDVLIALLPVTLTAVYFFDTHALMLILASIATAVITEIVVRKILGRSVSINDYSAVVTGLLVALVLPAHSSIWRAVLASFFAIVLAKELMGGLGWNRLNPALFGYAVTLMFGGWFAVNEVTILGQIDAVTQATPLAMLSQGVEMPGYGSMLLAHPGGSLGETSALAVILGGLYLLYRKQINWRIPTAILITVFLGALVAGQDPIYSLLGGGVLLGSFFMATDWVTCPINNRGKVVYAVLTGLLICLFRFVFPTTGGVAFSILIMNAAAPLIEKVTMQPLWELSNT